MSGETRTPNEVQAEQEAVMADLRAAMKRYEGTNAPILDIGQRILKLHEALTAEQNKEAQ